MLMKSVSFQQYKIQLKKTYEELDKKDQGNRYFFIIFRNDDFQSSDKLHLHKENMNGIQNSRNIVQELE